MFGRDRQTVEVAYAGDIVGLVNPGRFAIGDSLYAGRPVTFAVIPRFAAEHFGRLRIDGVGHKQFDRGVRELEEEGLMQVFYVPASGRDPIIGVVGPLQFEVVQSRLEAEYGVTCRVEPLSYTHVRRLEPKTVRPASLGGLSRNVLAVVDSAGDPRLLFGSVRDIEYAERENPNVRFIADA
jgi:peptide chain release factor 3